MPICPECQAYFTADLYFTLCNLCGEYLRLQYLKMQDFEKHALTWAELSGRAVFGSKNTPKPAWLAC